MTVTAEEFPRWLARNASRRISPAGHRIAVIAMMNWLVGPTATSTIVDRAAAGRAAPETPRRGRAKAPAARVPAMA